MNSEGSKKSKKNPKRKRISKFVDTKTGPKNVYDNSYTPGMIGSSAGPLPMKKRTSRKKKETYRQN